MGQETGGADWHATIERLRLADRDVRAWVELADADVLVGRRAAGGVGAARPGSARPGGAWPDAARPDASRPDPALPDAASLTSSQPLAGLCFGVKDVIDVAGLPTRSGSTASGAAPKALDATCVAQLRAAGATPVGKTVTAEYAYAAPGPTRNPRHPGHTPGGSSSGSAAAVAAGMVPFALGTQTGGSMIRPAAFCGVVGFKPTFGRVHRHGMDVLCDTLDTIGWFGASVAEVARVASVLLGPSQAMASPAAGGRSPRVLLLPASGLARISPAAGAALSSCAHALQAHGAVVTRLDDDAPLQAMLALHGQIMHAELARALLPVVRDDAQALSPVLRQAIADGLAIDYCSYTKAQQQRADWARRWADQMADVDVIVTPSSVGEAPEGLASTGSSVMNRVWSLLGWPSLHLPTGTGEKGLPVGVQWVGRPDDDAALLGWAQAWFDVVDRRNRPLHMDSLSNRA